MSKKKKIKNLQKQVEDLEAKLATQEETKETSKKRAAKTAVNVYFDSNFVNSLVTANEGRSSRERGGERLKKKRIHRGFRIFLRILWKFIVIALIIAIILAVLSIVAMGVVWLLVNMGVWTTTQNQFVIFVWRMLEMTFGLFGMTVPTI